MTRLSLQLLGALQVTLEGAPITGFQLGCLDLAEGDHARAYQQLRDATAACQDVGQRDDLSWGFAVLAISAIGLGQRREARQHLSRSFQLAADQGVVPPLLWALPAMALLWAGEGESERAVELYALASRFPLVAKSRWFADVAGNTLAEVAATLPAERVAVLQDRGRARDLDATVAELLAEFSE